MSSLQPLADAFPRFTEADWRAAVAHMRRGGVATHRDSDDSGPLFQRRADARVIAGQRAGQSWVAVERVDATDAVGAVGAVAEAAAGGATGVEIVFAGSLHPLGGRVPMDAATAIASELAGVIPERFHLRIDAGGSVEIASTFVDLATARKADLVFASDPVAAFAVQGGSFEAGELRDGVVIADGRLWHAGGATDEQELATVLATFVSYLRLAGTGARIDVAFAAGSDQYRTVAKFRAARLLLARVAEVAGLGGPVPRVHAETAWREMSTRNPEMNILRATSAAFAAAAGGADSITLLPFDALGGGDRHGRRLARNTQAILAEEANLFRVADPGAGSGAIEAMTAALAEAAWKRFQAIEAQGGIVAAIGKGALLREIAAAREARVAGVVAREITMVGVNAFTGSEAPAATMRRVPVRQTERLSFRRLAEAFE